MDLMRSKTSAFWEARDKIGRPTGPGLDGESDPRAAMGERRRISAAVAETTKDEERGTGTRANTTRARAARGS